jgi:murein DD-endopeptidase MepM/ murein hydrolase activator NlpD
MAPRALLPVLCAAAALTLAGFADAAKVYRWTDAKGVRHYGDHVPQAVAGPVQTLDVARDPSPIASLRTQRAGEGIDAIVDNRLAGPVEVRLAFTRAANVHALPALPARAVVPAGRSRVVAHVTSVDPGRGGDFELRMEVVPGDPASRPLDVEYLLPLRLAGWRIDQGFGGSFSHDDDQNRYAVDFAAPIGTPVLAARGGRVMEVEADFARAGLSRERHAARANMIRLVHDDGAMSVYAHLRADGVLVRPGQRVRAGQQIGLSGNTGYSTGPHLHFAVQVNRGMRLESIPFRMRGPDGELRLRGNF